jgi:hypothetical protein
MITLSILGVLYTIFGFIRFKKLYGHYRLVDEEMQVWTLILALCAIFICMVAMLLIIKYLP